MTKTAVILQTHRFDANILSEFARMQINLPKTDKSFILSDGTVPAPPSLAPITHVLDVDRVLGRATGIIGEGILQNLHLSWIDFFENYPDFDTYWIIEYDVVYAGPWQEFFSAFRNVSSDLLCSHLRPSSHEPGWWALPQYALHAPQGEVQKSDLIRGFLPASRITRRGLETLRDAVDEGWWGFPESLVPTVLKVHGLPIADFGGSGPFVPPGSTDQFYTSVTDPMGSLGDQGTMRFRPPIRYPRLLSGRLYHPVKPGCYVIDGGADDYQSALSAIDQAISEVQRHEPGAEIPRFLQTAYIDHQLQVLTGLRTSELLIALDRLIACGAEASTVARVRQRLLALPFLSSALRGQRRP